MKNKYYYLIILFSVISLIVTYPSARMTYAQTDPLDDQSGLIGILFEDSAYQRPLSIWHLLSLDSADPAWPKYNDFSARWQGYIDGLADAEVTFSSEADNGLRLEIDGKVIIDSWADNPGGQGKLMMQSGKRYPIRLNYRQISGPSYLRIFWSADGKERESIPVTSLHFTAKDHSEIQQIFKQETEVPSEDLAFDISSLLTIKNKSDIESRRQVFATYLFGKKGIPLQKGIDVVEQDIKDADFQALANLRQINKLTINMDFGLNSIAYHFLPVTSNNKVVIYHQGHMGKFSIGISTISGLLAKGYHVVGLSMPLKGMNSQPVVNLKRFGKMLLSGHERMGFLEPEEGHPVKYFIEPVFRVINYLQTQGFKRFYMTGISGGGWTTTLCAALDTRIQYSYPVAGSLPIYLRVRDKKSGSWGDYEQVVPELYRIANYLELYILGATGSNRRQIQILNEFDSCCFSGTGFKSYRFLVQERIKSIGMGYFDVFLDSSHQEHKISDVALNLILDDLEK
jgi:hypothetical protein